MHAPEIAIVIVNWNGRDLLERCLRSIQATADPINYSVWIVDNGSTDGSQEMVRRDFPTVELIQSERNLGFAGGNNVALRALGLHPESPAQVRALTPEFVLLLNPDTIVQPGAMQALLATLRNYPHLGAAGALLLNEDGSFQASYIDFPTLGQEFMILTGLGRAINGPWYPSHSLSESSALRSVDYVVGACMLVRSSTIAGVGLLDEGFFMYSEEVDWCYRIRAAGWGIAFVPQAVIIHFGGGSTRQVRAQMLAELYRSRVRFFRKHYGDLAALSFKALLVTMNGAKMMRDGILRRAKGTPHLTWGLLRHALDG